MPVGVQLFIIFLFCLFSGVGVSIFYLKKKSETRQLNGLDGFISWFLFIITAFIINGIGMLFLAGIGDNPSAAAGGTVSIVLSVFLNPVIWFYIRAKSKGK